MSSTARRRHLPLSGEWVLAISRSDEVTGPVVQDLSDGGSPICPRVFHDVPYFEQTAGHDSALNIR